MTGYPPPPPYRKVWVRHCRRSWVRFLLKVAYFSETSLITSRSVNFVTVKVLYQHELCLFIILFPILFILCRHYTCLWPYLLHLWLWKLVSNVTLYSTTSACVSLLFINIIHTWKGLGTSRLGWVGVDLP